MEKGTPYYIKPWVCAIGQGVVARQPRHPTVEPKAGVEPCPGPPAKLSLVSAAAAKSELFRAGKWF